MGRGNPAPTTRRNRPSLTEQYWDQVFLGGEPGADEPIPSLKPFHNPGVSRHPLILDRQDSRYGLVPNLLLGNPLVAKLCLAQ